MPTINTLIPWIKIRSQRTQRGMATAEMLAYVALSVAVLVVLFGALQVLGLDTIAFVRRQIGV